MTPDGAGRQERKLVTVVFCDLVGFTGRAEVMDPEDVRALLSSYHRHLRRELERHGGTVEKFIGDAVVAVFGAPVVHEDDAERAVRSAIAIRDWAAEQADIEVRVAVNTGEALVSLDVDPASGEGMVAGDVINTAARIQVAAPVNGVLAGEQTYRATRDAIEYAEHEPFVAHGKAQPVTVWEVLSARGRVRAGSVPHERSAFVGRERELGILREAYARMRDAHEPQLVTMIAVPGSGKSRLVYELSKVVDADPDLVCWRQGQCLPYGDGVSFWALAEIVKAETGILESDPPDVAAAKLAEAVRALVPSADAEWIERDLRPLIGLAEPARGYGARLEGAFPAWHRFVEALAERGPCVLVVEDLHWADDGLLDFLDQLTEVCAGLPLLLVATARPELLARRPTWGGGKANSATVALPPLSESDTARIVQTMLARPALSADLQRHLLERAGGNPLYAEEFARMLAERGDADLTIPETVQGIIAARLDGLEPDRKRLLQDASVVGATFWLGAVARLEGVDRATVEAALRQLEQREFIRRERRSSVEGEAEYAFRHGLVRDATYGQIPRAERSEKHRRAAEWTTELGRSDDHAELVAHHYLEASRYAEAAGLDVGHLAAPARVALREAGERALRLGAYPQAARYLGAAIDLVDEGDDRGAVMYHYGLARMYADSTGEEVIVEAAALLRASGNWELAARATLNLAYFAWSRVDHDGMDARLREIDELTADHPDSIVRLETLVTRSGFYMTAGQYERAIDIATTALERLDGLDRPDLLARTLDVRGTSRCARGDQDGLTDSRRAIAVARSGRAVWELHHAMNNVATSAVQLGRTQEVRGLIREWREALAEVGGSHHARQWFKISGAEAALHHGDWDRAMAEINQYLDDIPAGQTQYLAPSAFGFRAAIRFARGHDAPALDDAERTLELAKLGADPQTAVPAFQLHGRLMIATGRRSAAEADWAGLIAIEDDLPGALPQASIPDFCWLAADLGHTEQALAIIERCPPPAWKSVGRAILRGDAATAGAELERMDRLDEAAYSRLRAGGADVEAALEFYESVGASRYVAECRALLDASA